MTADSSKASPETRPGSFSNSYPADIHALTSLRLAAAMWVLLFFFGERLGLGWRDSSGFVAKGYLGVDLFFILSGFILAHVYGPKVIDKRFNFGSFLWARIARLYPVHFVALAILVILAVVAKRAGLAVNPAFDFDTLWAQALMVHGWGFVPGGGWNHPSWSISAEWSAYILFPLLFVLASLFRKWPVLGVIGGFVTFMLLWLLTPHLPFANGAQLTDFTAFGAIRIMPSFLMGVALWRLGQKVSLSGITAWALACICASIVVAASSFRFPDPVIWLGLAGLIFSLAETAKSGSAGVLGWPSALWLGEASYALYMIHMPVDLIWFQVIERVLSPDLVQAWRLGIVMIAILISFVAAGLLYTLIEKPARAWLRTRDPFKRHDLGR